MRTRFDMRNSSLVVHSSGVSDASGDVTGLWLSKTPSSTRRATLVNRSPANGDWTAVEIPIGTSVGLVGSYNALSFNVGTSGNIHVFTGSSPTTWTWTQDSTASVVGYRLTVKNKGTAALTFSLGGSGNNSFDGIGKTSALLAAPTANTPGGSITIECVGVGQWVVTSLVNTTFP
jgi:hypothetical protein